MKVRLAFACCLSVWAAASAVAQPDDNGTPPPDQQPSICSLVETAARSNGLPVSFFARLIWQESRFQPEVVGPLTSSGEHALGIAQFMPGTAAERHLFEPFNPVEALPKSSEFLAELRSQFGNLGLAAAAYNAGPQRLRDFLSGLRDLPLETRNYVMIVTGRSVEEWANHAKANDQEEFALKGPEGNCQDVIAASKSVVATASPTLAELRAVPSWCRFVHHPSVSVCGTVHQSDASIRISSLQKQKMAGPLAKAAR